MKVYLVEDDKSIRELIVYTLNYQGYEGKGFEAPSLFWEAVKEDTPDLILLDLMLPEEDGLNILKKIRSNPKLKDIPVMMITARDSEYDKVIGLESGADDYVTKPFGMMELMARVKALLRRAGRGEKTREMTCGKIRLNPDSHEVLVSGAPVKLTSKEYELIKVLMENKEMVLSREQLLEKIWGYEFDGENRTVDVHIRSLRKKLGDQSSHIETVRGFGYRATEQVS